MKRMVYLLIVAGLTAIGGTQGSSWPATDGLGRQLPGFDEVGPARDRTVALFYFLWQNYHTTSGPHNIGQILADYPEAISNVNHSAWGPLHHFHHFAEPLFGYYRSTDEWVYRKHAEMLADAGVDVIILDATNGFTYQESYLALCRAFDQAQQDGVDVPKIAFIGRFGTGAESVAVVQELYTDLYEPGLYSNLWFYWEGKPLIMAYPDGTPSAINAFFTFRGPMPDYFTAPSRTDQWGWLQVYPQHGFGGTPSQPEQMTVGVAMNATATGLTAMSDPEVLMGRSYHDGQKDTTPGAYQYGLNFQEQWDYAIEVDPEMIFITGWNEWTALRMGTNDWPYYSDPDRVIFPDVFDEEYSRDIEPMKGGYGDNYYYQMISNIRRFKGLQPPLAAGEPVAISIDGVFTDWADVAPDFQHPQGSTQHRDWPGWGDSLQYTNTNGRNDVVSSKVARSGDELYFYVKAAASLSPISGPAWMLLFINSDRSDLTGWEGYDFRIDQYAADGKATLGKSSGDWNWTEVARVDYRVVGSEMEIAIPRALLNLSAKQLLDLEFKWVDNLNPSGDIMEFYTCGEAAPGGRFNYRYHESIVLFQDTFEVVTPVWDNPNTELSARQAEGTTNSTYTLAIDSALSLLIMDSGGIPSSSALMRINTSGGGGGVTSLDLDTDFGADLMNTIWSLSFKGRIDASVGYAGWVGFAVGNPAETPDGGGFGINLFNNGSFQIWTNGVNVHTGSMGYDIAAKVYDLTATFDEEANTVSLTYSDETTHINMGNFPTGFTDNNRLIELKNLAASSTGNGIVDWRVDDLSVEVISYMSPYAKWATDNGLASIDAVRDADPDEDGMNNLAEYALGGNPNVDDAATILPAFEITAAGGGSNFMDYIYNRRLNAASLGLTYGLNTSTNLQSAWIYSSNAYETGSADIDLDFESVSNSISVSGLQGFIQLEVAED